MPLAPVIPIIRVFMKHQSCAGSSRDQTFRALSSLIAMDIGKYKITLRIKVDRLKHLGGLN